MSIAAPFPWPGNKTKVADIIVSRLLQRGPVRQYIEPFAGGLAVMLRVPTDVYRLAGDFDGVLVNLWRAIQADPEAVADAADIQVSGAALVAAHRELAAREGPLLGMLAADLNAYDARAAGLRLYCMGAQIKHSDIPTDPDRAGIHTIIGHHLASGRRPTTANLARIRDALRGAKLLHGDWRSTLTTACFGSRSPASIAVLLDPPYSEGDGAYRHCSSAGEPSIAQAAAQWAREHPDMRVALCGAPGEHEMPGWETYEWSRGGRAGQGRGECIWFSSGCGPCPDTTGQTSLL